MSTTTTCILLYASLFVCLQVLATEETTEEEPVVIEKRQPWVSMALPNCPYTATYKVLNNSFDKDHKPVKIAQSVVTQHFQVVECTRQGGGSVPNDCPNCCRGVDPTLFYSKCEETSALVKARVCRTVTDCTRSRNAYIYINNGCACQVKNVIPIPG